MSPQLTRLRAITGYHWHAAGCDLNMQQLVCHCVGAGPNTLG